MKNEGIKKLLEAMWQDYIKLNPLAKKIFDLFTSRGEKVINDHIALRTFSHPKIGVDVLARPFVEAGYIACGEYQFASKKLFAKHYEHEDKEMPRVFISELLVDELSPKAQKIIKGLIDQVDGSTTFEKDFIYSGRPWSADSNVYQELLQESEYAAWMCAFGFRPNHFTVSVNELEKFNDIEDVNEFLRSESISLNESGGEVKGSEKDYLKQSSTLANKIDVKFSDKVMQIPSCYYEFAKRFKTESGELFQGFVAKSADKIFESTDQKEQG